MLEDLQVSKEKRLNDMGKTNILAGITSELYHASFLSIASREWLRSFSLEIHTLFLFTTKKIQLTQQQKLLEREYGGGSMFEFQAKMTVVKKNSE